MDNTKNGASVIKTNLIQAIKLGIENYKNDFGELGTFSEFHPDGDLWDLYGFKPYFSRKRKLSLEEVIFLLLSMQGGSLNRELHDAGIDVTASAFVQQRGKIPSLLLEYIGESFNRLCCDSQRYKGYRIFAVDGTTINMARNPQSDTFVQNSSNPRGYNQFHVTPLYDVLNKTYFQCVIQPQPQQDEIGALTAMLKFYDFLPQTLIVADRGFESYNIIAHFLECKNVNFLIRVKQNYGAMREIESLPMEELDRQISFVLTTTQTNTDKEKNYVYLRIPQNKNKIYKSRKQRWDFGSPYSMSFRVLRFLLETGEYETLVTDLPKSFSLSEIKELYHARWGIETAFRELKYGLGLVNLHSKKDDLVRQEIYAAMIMANFSNRIANLAVIEKKRKTIHEYKINAKMAYHLCREFFRTEDADAEQLLKNIGKYTEPVRPGRRDERNLKAKSFVGFIYRV